jgi:hypothetical protein
MWFEEEQRFGQAWLWVILAIGFAPVVIFVLGLYQQLVRGIPFGNQPMSDGALVMTTVSVFAFMVALVLLFRYARLRVTVDATDLVIDFRPFQLKPRRIALRDLAGAAATAYNPLLEYGGWGVRFSPRGMAYNVSGSEGVLLELQNGKRVMIGSQRAPELEAAIASAQRASSIGTSAG